MGAGQHGHAGAAHPDGVAVGLALIQEDRFKLRIALPDRLDPVKRVLQILDQFAVFIMNLGQFLDSLFVHGLQIVDLPGQTFVSLLLLLVLFIEIEETAQGRDGEE